MKTRLTKFLKVAVFLLILVAVLDMIIYPLWLKDEGYATEVFRGFYDLPKESLDFVIIGSSAAREYYAQPEAFHSYGVAGYALATSGQPFATTKYLVEEAEKTQSPKVYLFEIRELTSTRAIQEGDVRKVIDSMRFSVNRWKTVTALLENYQYENPDVKINKWDYYLSISTYHTRYSELTESDFTEPEDQPVWSGFDVDIYTEPHEYYGMGEAEENELSGYRETALRDILEYCRTLDAQVIFTCTPGVYIYYEEKPGRVRYLQNEIEEAGFPFWNMNDPDVIQEMGLDFSADMKNDMHVNFYGAVKVTDYIARRLQDEYGIQDKRGDKTYQFWEEEYDEMMQEVARQEAAAADANQTGE